MPYIKRVRKMVGHEPLIMTSASGALLNEHHQVLLQARADTGDWGFPGGYMEYGEAFADTVKREFKEDAGFEIQPVKLLKCRIRISIPIQMVIRSSPSMLSSSSS